MEHRILGRTGVRVTPLCIGTMNFGSMVEPDHDVAIRIIHRALDAGINFVDTADIYSLGESEEIVGKALAGRRDDVVLATKAFNPMGEDVNRRGGSRRWLVQAVEDSLRRLRTDWIDLYQVHRFDEATELEETLGVLDDLVRQGKIRYAGTSTYPASRIVEAQWVSRERGTVRPVCEQPPYSMLDRGIEADVLPTCLRHGIGVITWSPLAAGYLSGRWRRGGEQFASARAERAPARFDASVPENQRKLEVADALAALADEAGLTLVQMALAWVLRHPAITSAILGPRTLEHLEGQLGADEVVLDDALLDRIDEVVAPGTTLNADDIAWQNPALAAAARRR